MTQSVTAIILTKDEAIHIERCIRSVQVICSSVLIVDSFSTDDTCAIAKRLGAKVVQHKFTNQAEQFNWAIDNLDIKTEWIWRVDADEIIEEGLAKIAEKELPNVPKNVNGIYVNKKIVFMGRPLFHGGWYPAPQIKIIRNGFGRSEDKLMDEHLVVTSGDTISWNGDQTDWNLKPLDWWWEKHEGYALREAQMQVMKHEAQKAENDEVEGKLFGTDAEWKRWMKNLYAHFPLYVRPIIYFLGRYIFMGGFLDGYAGWYWHTRQGLKYRMLVDINIAKLRKSQNI
ncbi:MAG: glycosyltransferase family 2 protein [Bacteroidales bacterium]|nr:glycosyltransferase family 2 protein [Bacteroidales bacterium]